LININAKSTEIVPDDFQHTTCKDAGSAENAYAHGWTVLGHRRSSCRGAIFSHSIHGDALKSFPTIFSIHSIHGDKIIKNVELKTWENLSL
jgi:hypothetical protein